MFSCIVKCINDAIELKESASGGQQQGQTSIIGVLDIYGFEIFDNNRLEINDISIVLDISMVLRYLITIGC